MNQLIYNLKKNLILLRSALKVLPFKKTTQKTILLLQMNANLQITSAKKLMKVKEETNPCKIVWFALINLQIL